MNSPPEATMRSKPWLMCNYRLICTANISTSLRTTVLTTQSQTLRAQTNKKLRYLLMPNMPIPTKITARCADKTVTAPVITHSPFSSGSGHASSIQHPFSPDRLNCPALACSDCRYHPDAEPHERAESGYRQSVQRPRGT